MSIELAFELFLIAHIVTGAVGLVSFWVPVVGRKGGRNHRKWGRVFTYCLIVTGCFAVGMSSCTLIDPIGTHQHLVGHAEFGTAPIIRGIFGWMMLYLAILTVNLAWYGWLCIRNKSVREACRGPVNLGLQALLTLAAALCVWQGFVLAQPLMLGISIVGFATVGTNLFYLYKPKPLPKEWLMEHVKALVGAGISVYTAFLAFGAVRLLPEAALTPALWAVPLIVGLAIIIYHRRAIARQARGPSVASRSRLSATNAS